MEKQQQWGKLVREKLFVCSTEVPSVTFNRNLLYSKTNWDIILLFLYNRSDDNNSKWLTHA